ncbi:hypothetical protein EV363DRAFT_1456930 [Boletus edulis]|uniref:DASH complex subunit DAD2 n=1 Tax=Boletus edulis BED1 TaxID=1328754 RepID=A0AAD4BCG7_BOLED|nr:hypothetical protein EV363DRAFT_1456930 [Boletus edulis]KAF8417820.1 hypothetical protein L210DRAFT_3493101 [Boletus edulis BED1]
MRPSIAPHRASHAHALAAQANNPASVHRLMEKKKEHEAVAALERASALFVKRIEGLADDCEVMADAGQVHGQVLEQWPNMFRILGLFLANRQQYAESEASLATLESAPGERLVRIPLDEVQAVNAKPS